MSAWTKPPELVGDDDEQQQQQQLPLLATPSATPLLHPYKNNYRNEQYQHELHQSEAHRRRQDARAEKVCCEIEHGTSSSSSWLHLTHVILS